MTRRPILVAFLAVILTALLHIAGCALRVAYSADLALVDRWHPDGMTLLKMRALGAGPGYLAAADSSHLIWLRFGARFDTLTWARGQTIALTLKDGRELEAGPVWGMRGKDSPLPGERIELGLASRLLRREDLDQGRYGRGGLILAGFREPVQVKDVQQIVVRMRRK